jgi:hypothetical protein
MSNFKLFCQRKSVLNICFWVTPFSGIISPTIFLFFSARDANTAATEESTPPLIPIATPFFFLWLGLQ